MLSPKEGKPEGRQMGPSWKGTGRTGVRSGPSRGLAVCVRPRPSYRRHRMMSERRDRLPPRRDGDDGDHVLQFMGIRIGSLGSKGGWMKHRTRRRSALNKCSISSLSDQGLLDLLKCCHCELVHKAETAKIPLVGTDSSKRVVHCSVTC